MPNPALCFLSLLLLAFGCPASEPGGVSATFEQANKLYEQGKYTEAAKAYETLVEWGHGTPAVYYNLGNAWFKQGQKGRAILAYRRAARENPRDPNLHFNLGFARKAVTGNERPPESAWQAFLHRFTLDEWTLAATTVFWTLFGLLSWSELRPDAARGLRKFIVLTALFAAVLATATGLSAWTRHEASAAVVLTPNAVVRYGPLEESQVAFQLVDGSEVTIIDTKALPDRQTWVQVRDASGRTGWLRRDQLGII